MVHGCNVFINRQIIYNLLESIYAKNGMMANEYASFDGVEHLTAVTGGDVSTSKYPELETLGQCDIFEEIMIGKTK
eukprot:8276024-Ditylum_brightwellii.AAC.1